MTVSTGPDKHEARGFCRRISHREVGGEEMVNAVMLFIPLVGCLCVYVCVCMYVGEGGGGGVSRSEVLMKAFLMKKLFFFSLTSSFS